MCIIMQIGHSMHELMLQTQKCVELLSEVMDILYRTDIGPTQQDISYVMHILLRPIIYSIGTIGDNDPMAVSNINYQKFLNLAFSVT